MNNLKEILKPAALTLISLAMIVQFQPARGQDKGSLADLSANRTIVEHRLAQFIDEVKKNNPGLKALASKISAAQASVNYAKSLDPPQIGVEFYQSPITTFPNPFDGQREIDYSVQQMFPFPGKLSAMARVEQNRKAMTEGERTGALQRIVGDLKAAFYEAYFIQRKIEINDENREILKSYAAIAQKQYEVGTGKQADILRAQTELSTLVNNDIVFRQELRSMEAMLNALRNQPVETPVDPIPEIEPPLFDCPLAGLVKLALEHRPELSEMEAGVSMQKAELAAAKKEYYPDFMVRGMYKQMLRQSDDWDFTVGITVPVAPWSFGKASAGANRASLLQNQYEEELNNMKNMVASEVQQALIAVRSSTDRIKLYKMTVIPQATQTLNSTLASYRSGGQDFVSLIDAHHMLLSARQDYHMAVMNLMTGISKLETAVGMSVEDIEKSPMQEERK
ncbi:MAG TPA: TolC family protein [Chitinivibrionales bacterium]|nr:TolC family protein [Chitinivibrionales bacterium]